MSEGGINIYPGYTGLLCLYHHITKHVIIQWTGLDGVDQQVKLDAEENLLSFFKATVDVSNEDGIDNIAVDEIPAADIGGLHVEVAESSNSRTETVEYGVEPDHAFSLIAATADINVLGTKVKDEPSDYAPTDIEVPVTAYSTETTQTSSDLMEDTESTDRGSTSRSTADVEVPVIAYSTETAQTSSDLMEDTESTDRESTSRSTADIEIPVTSYSTDKVCTSPDMMEHATSNSVVGEHVPTDRGSTSTGAADVASAVGPGSSAAGPASSAVGPASSAVGHASSAVGPVPSAVTPVCTAATAASSDVGSVALPASPAASAATNIIKHKTAASTTIKLQIGDKEFMIFPYDSNETVGKLLSDISEECVMGRDTPCHVTDIDGTRFSRSMVLGRLVPPFIIVLGMCRNEVEEVTRDEELVGEGSDNESIDLERQNTCQFKIVTEPEQAVKLMQTIYRMVKQGKCASIHGALLKLKKDRKTLDRFKNIYYLHCLDPQLLKQETNSWRKDNAGGLAKLDATCKDLVDLNELELAVEEGRALLFGKHK